MSCVVLVDVDGTLLGGASTELRFVMHLLRRRRIGLRQVLQAAAFPLRWFARYGRHVFKKNKAYLAGLAVADIEAEAEIFVRQTVAPLLRQEILTLIAGHVTRGETVMLLTGTPAFIAAPLAKLIGAQSVCATHCVHQGGVFTADPPQLHPFGEAKVTFAREICRTLGHPLADAVAYADSIHDLPLLLQVGHPVAAWPDAPLRQIATKGNWQLLPQHGLPWHAVTDRKKTYG